MVFQNNVFLDQANWPVDLALKDGHPILGNPDFANAGGYKIEDYIPGNISLVKNKGIPVQLLPEDSTGLMQPFSLGKDILGNPIDTARSSIGAIEPIE